MNIKLEIGVDEVGRGALAGPVIAAALLKLDSDFHIQGVTDSKKIPPRKREILAAKIMSSYSYAFGEASSHEIDEINILNATKLAMTRAVNNCIALLRKHSEDFEIEILVDGNMKFENERFKSIIKGDLSVYSISCASIIAKVHRDDIMRKASEFHPEFDWAKNVGYGTKAHFEAIRKHGLTKLHRKTFLNKLRSF
ncbi:MAG: ribonuclease HII [Rickettsiaceae bacterium]|nr:ribonuclease HII [Rickettsiaceae bacterium]